MSAVLAGDFKLAEYSRTVYHVVAKHPLEEVLKPEYWVHVASGLRAFDEIVVNAEDGSYHAKLLVTYAEGKTIKVALLSEHRLSVQEPDAIVAEGYTIKWMGPQVKFGVIRDSDRHELKRGFGDKIQAAAWLNEHLRKVA